MTQHNTDPGVKVWRLAVSMDGTTRQTDYLNIKARTEQEATAKARALPRVRAVKWCAELGADGKRV